MDYVRQNVTINDDIFFFIDKLSLILSTIYAHKNLLLFPNKYVKIVEAVAFCFVYALCVNRHLPLNNFFISTYQASLCTWLFLCARFQYLYQSLSV